VSTAAAAATRRKRFERDHPRPFQITPRDVELVRQVARHRYLRSTHLSTLVAGPHKKVCDRLTALFHAGYLERPRAQLEYHVTGGGSAPMVYALGGRGARLLREHDGARERAQPKALDVGRPYVLHVLAIADLRVALARAMRSREGLALFEGNDANFAERPGAARNVAAHAPFDVVPDHTFVLRLPNGRHRCYFVEVDRETMPIVRREAAGDKSSILKKLNAYAAIRRRKLHISALGWQSFRVLFITPSPARTQSILAAVGMHVPLHTDLFLAGDHSLLDANADVLNARWLDARGQLHTLA
jgi:hypothetical protein